mmetsp:Transcript_1011/g.2985  ORF Transcript_1011/g.2985 Transcript_1011/m.2985 type:complete len:377 (+) Transcript_1011:1062-2192(+)
MARVRRQRLRVPQRVARAAPAVEALVRVAHQGVGDALAHLARPLDEEVVVDRARILRLVDDDDLILLRGAKVPQRVDDGAARDEAVIHPGRARITSMIPEVVALGEFRERQLAVAVGRELAQRNHGFPKRPREGPEVRQALASFRPIFLDPVEARILDARDVQVQRVHELREHFPGVRRERALVGGRLVDLARAPDRRSRESAGIEGPAREGPGHLAPELPEHGRVQRRAVGAGRRGAQLGLHLLEHANIEVIHGHLQILRLIAPHGLDRRERLSGAGVRFDDQELLVRGLRVERIRRVGLLLVRQRARRRRRRRARQPELGRGHIQRVDRLLQIPQEHAPPRQRHVQARAVPVAVDERAEQARAELAHGLGRQRF